MSIADLERRIAEVRAARRDLGLARSAYAQAKAGWLKFWLFAVSLVRGVIPW